MYTCYNSCPYRLLQTVSVEHLLSAATGHWLGLRLTSSGFSSCHDIRKPRLLQFPRRQGVPGTASMLQKMPIIGCLTSLSLTSSGSHWPEDLTWSGQYCPGHRLLTISRPSFCHAWEPRIPSFLAVVGVRAWVRAYMCINSIRSSLHSVRFGQLLHCAHKRIVNILKVYIERNNMQVELPFSAHGKSGMISG